MDIGARLKELRLLNGLTQEELASRCELSKGFLSQVERNLTSPSISTLEDMLEALGSSLSDFFSEESEDPVVFGQEDYFVAKSENGTIEWIVPNAQKHDMEPILLTLQPGEVSKTLVAFEGEDFGYVLEGAIEIAMEGRSYPAKSGETFYLDGKTSHWLKNTGTVPARVLWITSPPMF